MSWQTAAELPYVGSTAVGKPILAGATCAGRLCTLIFAHFTSMNATKREPQEPHLDALGDIYDKQHHVNDVGASEDGSDEGCMAGAVHQSELHLLAVQPLHSARSRSA